MDDGGCGNSQAGRWPDTLPTDGYYTEVVTKTPDKVSGWTRVRKQPACRHDKRAVITFCDGHTESWRFDEVRKNKDDIFAMDSL